ncbi:MAG TPA: ABC transporter permease subunit [Acidimicrobiales bacterium]|nr:ABC transporter permease subunit [Acidimicrobiales bacterium]
MSRPGWNSLTDRLTRAGRPLFWMIVAGAILAPCACFMALAVSPRLFDQGPQWFTLQYLRGVLSGGVAHALADSMWVSAVAAVMGAAIGFPMAWLVCRTTMPGRRFIRGGMWLVLLLPSWLPALGWVRLVQPDGVMYRIGLDLPVVTHLILGPFGVVLLLGLRCVPFAFLAVSAALAGLGQEFEDAARVHGAGRLGSLRVVAHILAPAIWSALAIGFAESVSDFGVAATLAYSAHFPLATYQLYSAIDNFPPSFPAAAAMGWLLVGSVAIPLALQAKALRGRSYAVLSGRTRPLNPVVMSRRATFGAAAGVSAFAFVALGIPGLGAVSGSLLADFGSSFRVSFANYDAIIHNPTLIGPIDRSLVYGIVAATVTVVAGFVAARMLARTRTKATRTLDMLLLAAVALPSVVFAAGYIFAYNLPFMSKIGIDLYQTTTLLVVAYIASSLPTNARILFGSVSQLQPSLHDAARAHGSGPVRAWGRGVLPAISRPLVMAWLLTFCAVFLELPISQLLYAPSSPPISVAIQDNLGNYHYGIGIAQAVVSVILALLAVGVVLGAYRLLAPAGWRRIGALTRG